MSLGVFVAMGVTYWAVNCVSGSIELLLAEKTTFI